MNTSDEGAALLLALVRRKGSAHALADYLLERVPTTDEDDTEWVVYVKSRTMTAGIGWDDVTRRTVVVKLRFWYGRDQLDRFFAPDDLVFVALDNPRAGELLAMYLNDVFIRRRRKRVRFTDGGH